MIDNLVYSYQNGNNQLSSLSESASPTSFKWDGESVSRYVYDANGNLLCDTGGWNSSLNKWDCGLTYKTDPLQRITYDDRDLPLTFQKDGQTITYRYNAAGQRIYKKVVGATIVEEHYIMNGSELVALVNGSGALQYWQTAWGRYEKNGTNFTTYYYLRDHLGSTRVVLSESGQRVEAADYYAFGLKMPTRSAGTSTKHWNTGKERDLETGWDYFGARYYNPSIARWMNVDPMADKFPSLSSYNYVFNNPIQVIDPDGMEPCPPKCDGYMRDGEIFALQEIGVDAVSPQSTRDGRSKFRRWIQDKAVPAVRKGLSKVVSFVKGFGIAVADNLALGTLHHKRTEGGSSEENLSEYNSGLVLGDATSVYIGGLTSGGGQALSGASVAGGGVCTLATGGVGTGVCVAGGTAGVAAGEALTVYGVGIMASASANLATGSGQVQGSNTDPNDGSADEADEVGLTHETGSKPPTYTDGTPNSIYTYVVGDGSVAKSNYIFDEAGNVIFQVDFMNHGGGMVSGHGHKMEVPGNISSGHTNNAHIPLGAVPKEYLKLPSGVQPKIKIGE